MAVSSIFVYAEDALNYKPMALCIIYCFISTFVGNLLLKTTKTAYKFTVITSHKEELVEEKEQGRFARMRKLNALRLEMKKAVHREDFEQAAKLRDEIRALEQEHKESA